jgi:hypothetical protein
LQQAPSDAGSLADSLAPLLQVDPGMNLPVQINQFLADLNALALIEPV